MDNSVKMFQELQETLLIQHLLLLAAQPGGPPFMKWPWYLTPGNINNGATALPLADTVLHTASRCQRPILRSHPTNFFFSFM